MDDDLYARMQAEAEQGIESAKAFAIMVSAFYQTLLTQGIEPQFATHITSEWMVTLINVQQESEDSE